VCGQKGRPLPLSTVACFARRDGKRLHSRYGKRQEARSDGVAPGQGATTLALSFRQSEILALARADGRVVVEDLAARFSVALQTIRRDLTELAEAGHLDRVHGGAVLRPGMANIGYSQRQVMNDAAKAAIGAACAARIAENSSLILTLGTTTEAVARELLGHRALTVVTNNINVAATLAANESCDILLTGGSLRRSDGGLVGELTSDFVRQFKVDCAVIGISAVDTDGDLLDFDLAEVRVLRSIIDRARQTFLVADASKIGRRAPVRLGSLADITCLFTDAPPPPGLAEACERLGCEVVVAPPAAGR
jgi:DeoR family transcriptional regulator, glycerol-3-phosphate regulon repressor